MKRDFSRARDDNPPGNCRVPERFSWKVRDLGDRLLLEAIAENRIENVFLDWSALSEFNGRASFDIDSAVNLLARRKLRIESFHSIHGPAFDLGETDARLREGALALHRLAIEAAASWGPCPVIFHLAAAFSPAARAAACESISHLLPIAEERGVVMALENMKAPYYGSRVEEIRFFLDRFPSRCLKVCLDIGHANISGGVFPVLDALGAETASVHVHDNSGTADEHLPPGMGAIPWAEVFSRLRDPVYGGCFASEARPPGSMTWSEAVKKTLRTICEAGAFAAGAGAGTHRDEEEKG